MELLLLLLRLSLLFITLHHQEQEQSASSSTKRQSQHCINVGTPKCIYSRGPEAEDREHILVQINTTLDDPLVGDI